ncbi:HAD family hydrolase [Paracoccus sp. (in: a-proteobacteria)]|uniref:HAD family hydrolase n=1 Tax=Paracoccus sp. TaxID=267 RepID=UPI003A847505
MTHIRAVIFDLDGCLVDSEAMSLETLADEMRAEGAGVSTDDLRRRYLGVSMQVIGDRMRAATGRPPPADFAARFENRLLARYPAELRLIDGAAALLEDLHGRGIAMAIATGGSIRRMTTTLRVSGLDARFTDRAFSADQVARGKPAPDLFLLAAEKLGIPPHACAVMEDSPHGIAGARAAGMRAVGFVGGSHLAGARDDHAERLRDAGAAMVLHELSGMLNALLSGSETS